ncbi:MAG: hypothetical protein ACREDR_18835 [Blastocatellia bacterium]
MRFGSIDRAAGYVGASTEVMMKKSSFIIFGDRCDEGVVTFKCGLLRCGIGNFSEGGIDECRAGVSPYRQCLKDAPLWWSA